ncbi:uncharacterized protein LOC105701246 [Orussus abietinus]|uniref:uncharacterized protein LOC105701246 n=1 Tax=Orussus abietinus TaxID=222816 RepID=UPI0006251D31|nr:uncharacterized protein LOC105701246 [Orussus abietinus]
MAFAGRSKEVTEEEGCEYSNVTQTNGQLQNEIVYVNSFNREFSDSFRTRQGNDNERMSDTASWNRDDRKNVDAVAVCKNDDNDRQKFEMTTFENKSDSFRDVDSSKSFQVCGEFIPKVISTDVSKGTQPRPVETLFKYDQNGTLSSVSVSLKGRNTIDSADIFNKTDDWTSIKEFKYEIGDPMSGDSSVDITTGSDLSFTSLERNIDNILKDQNSLEGPKQLDIFETPMNCNIKSNKKGYLLSSSFLEDFEGEKDDALVSELSKLCINESSVSKATGFQKTPPIVHFSFSDVVDDLEIDSQSFSENSYENTGRDELEVSKEDISVSSACEDSDQDFQKEPENLCDVAKSPLNLAIKINRRNVISPPESFKKSGCKKKALPMPRMSTLNENIPSKFESFVKNLQENFSKIDPSLANNDKSSKIEDSIPDLQENSSTIDLAISSRDFSEKVSESVDRDEVEGRTEVASNEMLFNFFVEKNDSSRPETRSNVAQDLSDSRLILSEGLSPSQGFPENLSASIGRDETTQFKRNFSHEKSSFIEELEISNITPEILKQWTGSSKDSSNPSFQNACNSTFLRSRGPVLQDSGFQNHSSSSSNGSNPALGTSSIEIDVANLENGPSGKNPRNEPTVSANREDSIQPIEEENADSFTERNRVAEERKRGTNFKRRQSFPRMESADSGFPKNHLIFDNRLSKSSSSECLESCIVTFRSKVTSHRHEPANVNRSFEILSDYSLCDNIEPLQNFEIAPMGQTRHATENKAGIYRLISFD